VLSNAVTSNKLSAIRASHSLLKKKTIKEAIDGVKNSFVT
jgi:hypothetical protein